MTYMPEGGVTKLYNEIDDYEVDQLRKKWANKPTAGMAAATQQGSAINALNAAAPPPAPASTTPDASGTIKINTSGDNLPPAIAPIAAPQVSQYGLGKIKKGVLESAAQYQGKIDNAKSDIQKAFNKKKIAQAEIAGAQADELAAKSTIQQELYNQQATKIEHDQAARVGYNDRLNQFQKSISDEEKMAEYWNTDMTVDEIKQHESLILDPNVAPEIRAASKEKLRQAREVDPDRLLGHPAKKIGAALSIALGAFGAAFSGGKNYALDIINQSIADDIAAQRDAMASKKGKVQSTKNELSRYKQMFGDEEIAQLKLEQRKLEAAKIKNQALASKSQSAQVLAKADEINAGLDQQIAEKGLQLDALVNKDATDKAQLAGNLAVNQANIAKANVGFEMQAQAQNTQKELAMLKAQGKSADSGAIPGLEKTGTTTKEGDKKVREIFSDQRQFESMLDKIIKLREQYDVTERAKNKVGASKVASQMRGVASVLFAMLRKKQQAGAALTPSEERMMDPEGFIKDPTQVGFGVQAFESMRGAYATGFDDVLNTYGYRRVDQPVNDGYKPQSAQAN